jgi:hypothetical protein
MTRTISPSLGLSTATAVDRSYCCGGCGPEESGALLRTFSVAVQTVGRVAAVRR